MCVHTHQKVFSFLLQRTSTKKREARSTWELLLSFRHWVFKEIYGLDQREPGRNVVRVLMNLMDKGLELPNGLLAPCDVVPNTFGEREKQTSCLAFGVFPPISLPPPPVMLTPDGIPCTGRTLFIPCPWGCEVAESHWHPWEGRSPARAQNQPNDTFLLFKLEHNHM